MEILIIINNIYIKGVLYPSCIWSDKNKIYILTICMNKSKETIEIFKVDDSKGN